MVNTNCSVTSCMHNSESCCCKNEIMVDGQNATTSENTCCASFDERRGESFKNSYETPDEHLKINCEASQCVYNDNMICKADHVDISGNGADSARGTVCATFTCK